MATLVQLQAPTNIGGTIQAPNGTYAIPAGGVISVDPRDVPYLIGLGFEFVQSGGGGSTSKWKYISIADSPYQSKAGDWLLVDASGGNVEILPWTSPQDGDSIRVYDFEGNFGAHACIFNTENFYPQSDGALNCWQPNGSEFVFNATNFDMSEIIWQSDVGGDGFFAATSLATIGLFTSFNNTSPNDSVPVAIWEANSSLGNNVDVAIRPMGDGAILALIPDGSTNGNKRGSYAVDLQLLINKGSPTTVASGEYAFCEGNGNTASQVGAHAEGLQTIANGLACHAEGQNTTASNEATHAEGVDTSATAFAAHAEGVETQATNGATHAEGSQTTASGSASHAEGSGTTASGDESHAEGLNTQAIGDYSHAEGDGSIALGTASHASGVNTLADAQASEAGGQDSTTRGIFGAQAYATGAFSVQGDQQRLCVGLKGKTTDATPLVLTSDGTGPSTTNQLVLVDNETVFADVFVVGKVAGQGDCVALTFQTLIQRGIGAGSTAIPTTTTATPALTNVYATAGAISGQWSVNLTADTTNGALSVTVTGQDSTTINWTAEVRSRELVF